MQKQQLDLELAVRHMQHIVCAAINYQRTPIQRLKDDAARTVRVEAKVLQDLAECSDDPALKWAAREAALVLKNVIK